MKLRCLQAKYYRTGMPKQVVAGDEFEVSDELGTTILQDYPKGFAIIGDNPKGKAKQAKTEKNKQVGASPIDK